MIGINNNTTATGPACPAPQPRWQSLPPPRAKILLVDDDVAVREALSEVLRTENYYVLVAANRREAVQFWEKGNPDLLLLDLNLPGPGGWDTFVDMKRRRPFIPFVVITARPNQYWRATSAGIDAFMEKPLDLPCLLLAIEQLLRESPAERIARLSQSNFQTWNLNALLPVAEAKLRPESSIL